METNGHHLPPGAPKAVFGEVVASMAEDRRASRHTLRRIGRLALNTWLVIHLTAIIAAPATVGPSSQSARKVWEIFSPYLQACYLNHGFHYFAPQPGSSHLVSWTATMADGSTKSGVFPNPEIQPRLLYHRHFMLSEFLGNADPELQQQVIRSYARNLCREHSAVSVSVSLVRHDLPTMERVRAGGTLEDGDLYEEQPLGMFRWDELQ
ncbi:MAG: hypothetical protein R3C19_23970 [Planctomycetaceae bacterium]